MHKILVSIPSNIGENMAKTVIMTSTACMKTFTGGSQKERERFEKDGSQVVVAQVLDSADIEKIYNNAKKNVLNAAMVSCKDCSLPGDQLVVAVGPAEEIEFNKLSGHLRLFGRT